MIWAGPWRPQRSTQIGHAWQSHRSPGRSRWTTYVWPRAKPVSRGTVTLHLVHVAWDAAACAIAGMHHLRIDVQGNILVVARRPSLTGGR